MRRPLLLLLAFAVFSATVFAQAKATAPAPMPKPALDAVKEVTTRIAKSYSLLKDGKTEWVYKISSYERGKIDSIWTGLNRREVRSLRDWDQMARGIDAGQSAVIYVVRGGDAYFVTLSPE